jgi:hypothetical protein
MLGYRPLFCPLGTKFKGVIDMCVRSLFLATERMDGEAGRGCGQLEKKV